MIKKFYRPKIDRVFGGICAGLGYYTNIDPIFIRIIFFMLIFTPAPIITFYLLTWLFTDSE